MKQVWMARSFAARASVGREEVHSARARRGAERIEAVEIAPQIERREGECAVTVVEIDLHGTVVVMTEEEIGPAVAVEVGDGGTAVLATAAERTLEAGVKGDVDEGVGEGEGAGEGGEEEEEQQQKTEGEGRRSWCSRMVVTMMAMVVRKKHTTKRVDRHESVVISGTVSWWRKKERNGRRKSMSKEGRRE